MLKVMSGATDNGPLYVRIAEEIEAAMLRGEYSPGDRLPTELALAERHGVNRHTAGQALNRLQDKGLIYRVRGQGSFVRPGRIHYRVAPRMSFSDSVARAGLSPSNRVLSVRGISAYGRTAAEMGVPPGEPLVALEQLSYASGVPLTYAIKHYREALFPGIRDAFESGVYSVRELIKNRYGLDLYRARSDFEIEPADGEIRRRLGVPPGSALLKIESLDTLEDGTPAEWGFTYFRGDATRVRVELRDVTGGDRD